jgi:hypothetical protein
LGEGKRLPMVNLLEEIFPRLAKGDYSVTSPRDRDYNCVAWAAGDTRRWWWPGPDTEREYWPPGVRREETLSALQEAFASLGYAPCDDEGLEVGFDKVALFADAENVPMHVARQLPTGRWTSKLGTLEDIEHALRDLEGYSYGAVVLFLKRPLSAPGVTPSPDETPEQ